jgi:hypothetical protein
VDLDTAAAAVVDRLTAGGVRATLDGRNANPPCVLVRPPALTFRFGKGTWDAEWEAWAMVPATGQTGDLAALGRLVTAAQAALGGQVVTARPDEAQTADGATVPMYRLTWTARIPA